MPRRFVLALVMSVASVALAPTARAQIPFPRNIIPTPTSLGRLGLERAWYAVVPIGHGSETVISVSMAENLLFAQTNMGYLHAYDAESGRHLWEARLGTGSPEARAASVNSNSVFVTNGQVLYALDRRTGRILWTKQLESLPMSATAATEERVMVGLKTGKLLGYNVKDLRTKDNPYGQSPGSFAWAWQTNGAISSRPIPANAVVAFGSQDARVYVTVDSPPSIMMRWRAGGPVVAPLGTSGSRTLLVPSMDGNLYSVDLYTGETNWTFPSGAPIDREPLSGENDAYVVNAHGSMSAIDIKSGEPRWTLLSGAARLLSVSEKRIYARSFDLDLIVLDREQGTMLFDARATTQRAGVNLKDYPMVPVNRLNDRLYFGTHSGMLLALREKGQLKPRPVRKPGSVPFGAIEPKEAVITPPAATPAEDAKTGDEPKKDEEPKKDDETSKDDAKGDEPADAKPK